MRTLKNSFRLLRVLWVMLRYGALRVPGRPWVQSMLRPLRRRDAPKPYGKRLARALEALGPTFIKLGQALSTRADLMGEDVARDLARLRDQLPPFPWPQAKARLERAFDAPVENLFAEIDTQPVAAASIAQVHKARLHDGRLVAVKILRPEVRAAFARDISMFYWIAAILTRVLSGSARLKLKEVVAQFEESVRFEMDLRYEAAAGEELGEHMRPVKGFRVPTICWELVADDVLVMEWIDGIPVSSIAALKAAGLDTHTILTQAAEAFFAQVFRHGYFHADLHPGNLFIEPDGTIVAVDFGIMGRLDKPSRLFLAQILHGFLTQDYQKVAQAHFDAGYVPPSQSVERFALACRAIGQPIMGLPLNQISVAKLLGQLLQVSETFQMPVQPQLLLLQKSMMVTEGVGRILDPHINMWQVAEPLVESWVREEMGLPGLVRQEAAQWAKAVRHLPALVEDGRELVQWLREEQVARAKRETPIYRDNSLWLALIALTLCLLLLVQLAPYWN